MEKEQGLLKPDSWLCKGVSDDEADKMLRRHYADCNSVGFRRLGRNDRWEYIQELTHLSEIFNLGKREPPIEH